MFDLFADALKLDEFLIALLGHFVNEGAAKVAVSAVKAVGVAVLGFALEARQDGPGSRPSAKRTRQRPKRAGVPGPGRRGRGRGAKKTKS